MQEDYSIIFVRRLTVGGKQLLAWFIPPPDWDTKAFSPLMGDSVQESMETDMGDACMVVIGD